MSHAFSRSAGLTLVLAALVLFTVGPAWASVPPQQGGGAVGGIYNWYPLAPGQAVEWLFHYPGGDNPELIAFGTDPVNSIRINVYNDEQWRDLGVGQWWIEPVGRGTSGTLDKWTGEQDLIDNGDLFWEAEPGSAALFHIQITNASQGPARYWIAQGGTAGGELAPYSPIVAAGPTSQPTAAVSAAVIQPQPQQPITAGQTPSGGAGVEGSQPPLTLPVTGGASLLLLTGAGLTLVLLGWLFRPRTV
jgi:hypothetical protein